MTKATIVKVACVGLAAVLAAGCDEAHEVGEPGADEGEATPASLADGAPEREAVPPALMELERVLRRIDRGAAATGDADLLAAVVSDAKLPAEALDRASLGLSRAREASGDAEGAVRAVEELLERHGGDRHFEAHGAAVARLRLLLTGTEEAPASYARNMEPVAPVARALARFFPEDDRGGTLVDVLSVGRPPMKTDPHGILNIGGAKRALAEEECSVCDVDVDAHGSHTRVGSWADLPLQAGERRADMPNPDRSLVIVYFDLRENRAPSRYDAVLALPSEETVARLERGEAFVAARERPGKKPLVLLAAPRAGQLDQVEAAFAQLTDLPAEPHRVDVPKKLLPHEIQGVVRGGFRTFRGCYEALLARDAAAEGKITVKLAIDGEGAPRDVTADSTFADGAIATCIVEQFGALRFPASGETTNVTYPIAFSP